MASPLAGLALAPTSVAAHGVDPSYLALIESGTNLDYLWLGAVHMFTGYDHILFIIGIIFFLTTVTDIVKFITAFTIGHSLTLLFGALAGITASPYLVDAVIAVSVIYKGFDNLDGFRRYLGIEAPNALVLVFGFGLVHGFGLATRIQEFPLPTESLVARIASFNVGVELGQIAALIVILTVINLWRRLPSFRRFSLASNGGLVLGGVLLLLMQMHGYLHATNPHLSGAQADVPTASPAVIAEAASDHVIGLVTGGSVAPSWADVQTAHPVKRKIGGQDVWSVRFANGPALLTLYLSADGNSLLSYREAR
ncbi:MAG: HupE/UreJ family protein [Rhodospirillales bacterium]|nr:HupE/UreJ family protein [Rhodospirillales bacterium]